MASNRCKLYTGGVHLFNDEHLTSEKPSLNSSFTFASLPIEIRDQIYELLLVSTSNILVWKGERKNEYHYENNDWQPPCTTIKWRDVDKAATRASLAPLALDLFRCNKLVGRETARFFYTRNTFSFEGQHNFDVIEAWLREIGLTNRSFLASIHISAGRPDYGWQLASGERVRDPERHNLEEIYPRHPYLQLRADAREGHVDNINPSVEKIFVELGKRNSERKLKIIMQLLRGAYPGVRVARNWDDCLPHLGYYGMDLPNLMERCRSLHTKNVEVIWEGQDCRRELEEQQERLESLGWGVEILSATHDLHCPEWPPGSHGCHPFTDDWRIAKFVLRSKEQSGTLWADDACIYN